jgi:6,7-dimethyl-8-ribityllumazine synthase
MTTEGYWPGEPPAAEEKESVASEAVVTDVEQPEPALTPAAPAESPAWPRPDGQEPKAEAEVEPDSTGRAVAEPEAEDTEEEAEPEVPPAGHLPGELDIPDGVAVLEGSPSGADRTVGVVVSRFNGEISNRLLESALGALAAAGVLEERITVMPVPGAFELPIGAMALAKTRRYSCVIALGCVVRGETAHFEYVAGEAASGIQLAGLETGVPVAFGVLTVDTAEQAEARADKGADAARAALEMADVFSQVREQARA